MLSKRKPGRGKKYKIRVGIHNQGRLVPEVGVWAFQCPTKPPIYPRLNRVNQPVRVMVLRNNRGIFHGY